MSTNKPRLTITLEPEGAAVLERLSRLQKRPKARVLAEILDGIWPTLDRVADTLELALRAQQGAKEGLQRVLDEVEAEMRPLVATVQDQYDRLGTQLQLLADEGTPQVAAASPEPADGGRLARGGDRSQRRGRGGKDPRPVTTGVTNPERAAKTAKRRPRQGGKA